MMRELEEISWDRPPTSEDILLHGLSEIAGHAPGGHADPNNPCYGEKREYKDFASRILSAYRARGTKLDIGQLQDAVLMALCVLDDVRKEHGLTDNQERAYANIALGAGIEVAS